MTTARGAGHPANSSSKTRAHEPVRKSGYEKWQDGIDDANADWDAHDCEIRSSVDEYNRHLGRSPGYVPLNWKIVKTMLWVETGARDPQWGRRPMQIGNASDPGLPSLLLGNEGGALIIPPSIRRGLSVEGARSDPRQNIRAGIGYLLMRMASYAYKSVLDADTRIHEVTAMAGDSIERMAKAQGSTPEVMKKRNPSVGIVHAGDVLKYQKASVEQVITGLEPAVVGQHRATLQPRGLVLREEVSVRGVEHRQASGGRMRALIRVTMFLAAVVVAPGAPAGEKSFTGVFEGTGRACSGNLYIREKTAEWNTPFSVCKPARYELLEKDFAGEHKRLALRIKSRSKRCLYEVFEVEQVSRYGWNANAYQTLEAFQKRSQPDWDNSPLPERLTLSCPVVLR